MARYQALGGVEATTRALALLRADLRTGLRGLVKTATVAAQTRAQGAVPVARVVGGATRQAISKTYFDDGDTGSVFVAPTRDWRTNRRRPTNVPVWLEYGTRKMDGRPFLTPAGRQAGRQMEAEAIRLVTGAVRKAEV